MKHAISCKASCKKETLKLKGPWLCEGQPASPDFDPEPQILQTISNQSNRFVAVRFADLVRFQNLSFVQMSSFYYVMLFQRQLRKAHQS